MQVSAGLPDVLRAYADQVVADLGVDVCSIYLHENGSLVLRATCGLPQAGVGTVRMAVNEGLTGMVFTSGKPLAVSEPRRHPRYRDAGKVFDILGEDELRSYLGVPLPRGAGVLVVQTRTPHFFTQTEIMRTTWLAGQLASEALPAPSPN